MPASLKRKWDIGECPVAKITQNLFACFTEKMEQR